MSLYFKNKYRIPSIRHPGHDYSESGYYFITICTKNRICWLGDVVYEQEDSYAKLSEIGEIARKCLINLPNHYNCRLDEFIIMPNHLHIIIEIIEPVETGFKPVSNNRPQTGHRPVSTGTGYSLSEIIRGFKTFSAKEINLLRNTTGDVFWQSRFHDRIIRDEKELGAIRQYIVNNPLQWIFDRNNPNKIK